MAQSSSSSGSHTAPPPPSFANSFWTPDFNLEPLLAKVHAGTVENQEILRFVAVSVRSNGGQHQRGMTCTVLWSIRCDSCCAAACLLRSRNMRAAAVEVNPVPDVLRARARVRVPSSAVWTRLPIPQSRHTGPRQCLQ